MAASLRQLRAVKSSGSSGTRGGYPPTVEDRLPSGLWLELVRDADPAVRAKELSAAGLRVSRYAADPYPELPRRLDECASLLVAECAAADVSAAYAEVPPADPSTTVVPMRRYPRPAQGICTGEETTGLLLVLITPKTEADSQTLRDWADFIHLRWIAAAGVPGYRMITPYEHVEAGSPRYSHVYEMVTDDPRRTFESMRPRVADLLGGTESQAFRDWAWHPALRIDYVNTFRRTG